MQYADVVVPRGAENRVAMQLIVHHVKNQLETVQQMSYYNNVMFTSCRILQE